MEYAGILAAGLLVGSALTWAVHRGELKYLRDELRVTHAQIAHAVMSEGTQVPPRVEELEPIEALPGDLQSVINEWESPDSQAIEEAKIRGWLAEGWGIEAILRQYRAVSE